MHNISKMAILDKSTKLNSAFSYSLQNPATSISNSSLTPPENKMTPIAFSELYRFKKELEDFNEVRTYGGLSTESRNNHRQVKKLTEQFFKEFHSDVKDLRDFKVALSVFDKAEPAQIDAFINMVMDFKGEPYNNGKNISKINETLSDFVSKINGNKTLFGIGPDSANVLLDIADFLNSQIKDENVTPESCKEFIDQLMKRCSIIINPINQKDNESYLRRSAEYYQQEEAKLRQALQILPSLKKP